MGKTEKMNHTLRKTIPKSYQETHLTWDKVLLLTLLHLWVVPRHRLRLSPHEIAYGRPLLASCVLPPLTQIGEEAKIKQYVQHSNEILTLIHNFASSRTAPLLEETLHLFQPGDRSC